MLTLNECKKVLNKNNENYTDEEIKLIAGFIDNWAKMNAKTILAKLNKVKDEKSGNHGSCVK